MTISLAAEGSGDGAGPDVDGDLDITGIALAEDGELVAISETVPLADYLADPARATRRATQAWSGQAGEGPGRRRPRRARSRSRWTRRPGPASAFDALVIRDLPAGARLSAGAYDPAIDGWVLRPQDLSALAILPPPAQRTDFTLDPAGHRAASRRRQRRPHLGPAAGNARLSLPARRGSRRLRRTAQLVPPANCNACQSDRQPPIRSISARPIAESRRSHSNRRFPAIRPQIAGGSTPPAHERAAASQRARAWSQSAAKPMDRARAICNPAPQLKEPGREPRSAGLAAGQQQRGLRMRLPYKSLLGAAASVLLASTAMAQEHVAGTTTAPST